MQKKIFLIGAMMIFFSCCLLFFLVFSGKLSVEPQRVRIEEKEYALERADTNEKRMKGLGERDALCSSCAMLFVFDYPDRYAFWMKGMRFPIDIIWLRGDEIVHIERHVSENDQNLYVPEHDSDRVIELNAGEAASLEKGERVEFLK